MYRTECIKPEEFKPARFETDREIVLNGKTIPYHTVSEDNVFYNKDGKAVASIFSYSYFRSDVEDTSNRPVIFAYNGGPGSSSMYVHAGFLGTRRISFIQKNISIVERYWTSIITRAILPEMYIHCMF